MVELFIYRFIGIAFLLSIPLIVALLRWNGIRFGKLLAPKTRAGQILQGVVLVLPFCVAVRDLLLPQSTRNKYLDVAFITTFLVFSWIRLICVLVGSSTKDDTSGTTTSTNEQPQC